MKPSYNIVLAEEQELSQSEEYFLVEIDGVKKKIDLHDYLTIYQYPWLYDVLLYEHLGCKTPFEICQVLDKVFTDSNVNRSHINMLEIGAGSGIFADTLRKIIGVQRISGLDLYEAAKSAAERDRPGLYQEYYVADLTALSADMIKQLSEKRFNCIGVASATGWGNHIPVA